MDFLRGVLPEKLGGGGQPASLKPYPIYNQNLRISLPYWWPEKVASSKTHTQFKATMQTKYHEKKMPKIDTLFMTTTAENITPWFRTLATY